MNERSEEDLEGQMRWPGETDVHITTNLTFTSHAFEISLWCLSNGGLLNGSKVAARERVLDKET